jgi:uncharacterized protein DUF1444
MLERRSFMKLAGGAMSVVLSGPVLADDGPARFRGEVVSLLKRRRPDLVLELPDDDPQTIIIGQMHVFLGNLERQVAGLDKRTREKDIVGFFNNIISASKAATSRIRTWQEARRRLRIQVVPIEYRQQGSPLVSRDLSSKVIIAYALDAPALYHLVTRDMLSDWGVDAGAVHAAAIAGLEAVSSSMAIKIQRSKGGRGAFVIVSRRDGYDAARLLLPGFMRRVRQAIGENLVAAIPNRDFMAAWTPDFSAHASFVSLIEKDAATRDHPLTDELFISTAGGIRLATAQETAAQRAH